MCTRVVWPDASGAVLVGRNMDFHRDTETNLWALPRALERSDGVSGSLRWSAKYGSLIAGAFDLMSVDGINEAGLSGHVLWLAESKYGPRDESRPALGMSVWLQYFLDNFATVAEAVAWIDETKVQVVPLADPASGEVPRIHLALDDSKGDSVIIEYLGGSPTVHHDRSYQVVTNSPTFGEQLELLKEVEGFGGDTPLPGTTEASARFARASYYVGRLPEPASQVEAIAAMFSVMRNVAQPFRIPDPEKPYASRTIWQTVADLTRRRFVFESTMRPNIVWVDLEDLDLSEGAPARRLDLMGDTALRGGLAGNVAGEFEETAPMRFLALSSS